MQLTGSQVIIECLKEQGVDTVFGYPGGAILNVYDELYKHPEIKHVLTSHEQGASHAADGYARSTGKVGVCLATSGPGATNLVTGISTAYMDSIPIVAITCNVGVSLLGKDSFQEIDIAGITTPVTKYSFIVKDVEKLADTIRRAFNIARKGRPGPVLVDIPKNVTAELVEYTKQEIKLPERVTETITDSDIDNAIELIKASKKPYIFVGGGVVLSGASKELKEFVDKVNAPVCDTLMGKGAYDGTSDNYTGMLGMHGTKTSNLGVSECDLLIAIGTRFSDRVLGNPKKFADQAKILQFDVDAAEINKNIRVTSSVIGDVKEILTRINKKLTQLDLVALRGEDQLMLFAVEAHLEGDFVKRLVQSPFHLGHEFCAAGVIFVLVHHLAQLCFHLGKGFPPVLCPFPEALPELRQRNTLLAPFDKLFGVIVTRADFQCLFKISQSPALLIQIKVGVTHAEVPVIIVLEVFLMGL